jgi:hypothetical protein
MAQNRSVIQAQRITKFVLGFVSLMLGVFLILLGDKVLEDLNQLYQPPSYDAFRNTAALSTLAKPVETLDKANQAFTEQSATYEKTVEAARRNYDAEKTSFDNWLQTRQTLGSPAEDQIVLQKTKALDNLKQVELAWQAKHDDVQDSIKTISLRRSALEQQRSVIEAEDQQQYETALNRYTLKIFLLRLAIVIPLLGIGVWGIVKYRKHKYAPLLWGYVIFAVYVFFFGLVPYLPSYGGYVRYGIGIVLTILVGYNIIKQLTLYTERKNAELQKSTQERAKQIVSEAAVKAYQTHTCPSCDKDYMLGHSQDKSPSFCIHCGLDLFGKCKTCGEINFMHFPYCWSCGSGIKAQPQLESPLQT